MEVIFKRRSIRKYTEKPVSEKELEAILRAGMAAPSSDNNQEWEFVIVRDGATKAAMIEMNKYAGALKTAPLCIVVCADMNKVSEPDYIYWIQDLSAAAQNMLLAATCMDLGGLWIGLSAHQRQEISKLISLPPNVEPLMLLAFGTPQKPKDPIDRYYKERIHFERFEVRNE